MGHRVNWVSGSHGSWVTRSLGHKKWPSSISALYITTHWRIQAWADRVPPLIWACRGPRKAVCLGDSDMGGVLSFKSDHPQIWFVIYRPAPQIRLNSRPLCVIQITLLYCIVLYCIVLYCTYLSTFRYCTKPHSWVLSYKKYWTCLFYVLLLIYVLNVFTVM